MSDCQVAEVISYAALAIASWRCMTNPQMGAMEGCAMTMQDFYNTFKEIFPEKFKLEDGSLLYHYTTIDTFDKLVDEGGELYCTHYMDLNDDVEFWKGFRYFADRLERKCEADSEGHLLELKGVLGELADAWKRLHKLYMDAHWVMSFATERDSLSQWRFYTDRINGGVAIGFDRNELENELQKCREKNIDGYNVILMPCIYCGSGIDEHLDRLVDRLCDNIDTKQQLWHEDLARAMQFFSSLIKDNSFKSEHEWRIIIQASNIKALKGAKDIGGKVRLPLGIGVSGERRVGMLMKEVLLSPHGDKSRFLRSVVLPKYSCDKLSYEVRSSQLPYNGK